MLNSIYRWFKNLTNSDQKGYDYNSIYYKYHDFSLFDEFYRNQKKYVETESINLFTDHVNFNFRSKEIQERFGKPITRVNLSESSDFEIHLYKLIEKNEKQKILFHFFKDRLVLISRIFPYAQQDRVLTYQNEIIEQAQHPKMTEVADKKCLKGKDGNFIFLIHDVEYTEHYFMPDPEFKSFVKSEIKAFKNKK
ncbi:hypothetical protein [Psychroflexus salis]|uniref:Uncharacterized protein n=1 Tax=Psychroflexus salis TaxID=1526574 RepID=A0A917E8P2_9FLAO|nr:hypothetical protein [Psychroflexus salis]GGE10222.1 hypothetical protein GCM10010831_09660 [Psychroflexus salis]